MTYQDFSNWLMTDNYLYTKFFVIFLWLLTLLVIERKCPASPWAPSNHQQGFSQKIHFQQNGLLWLVNSLLSPLIVVTLTAFAVEYSLAWRQHPNTMWSLIFDIVVLDLWIYCWHRMNHVLPFFWRFHQVHHLDQQLDSTSALRFHFGEVMLSALFRMPIILLLAIPLSSVLLFELLVTSAAIFHHANIRLSGSVDRALSRVLITPNIHWVHHHAVRADTDSNYGTIFSFWDRLFGSRSATVRTQEMPLGIEGKVENSPLKLLITPFIRQT